MYEFDFSDRAETELKIKRRLHSRKAGPYSQDRVDLLRRLKNELQKEIGRHEKSRYYLDIHGRYAAMEDFDVKKLVKDAHKKFPDVALSDLELFVPFAVFTYYLR
jgi:hypothetical protein